MNRSMLIGALVGGSAVVGGLSTAAFHALTSKPAAPVEAKAAAPAPLYAEVLNVTPVKEVSSTPERQCRDVATTHRKPVRDEHRIAGTVIGGVLGGVVGHQIGGGQGKDLATVAGAVAGGYAGNRIQKNMQNNDTYTTNETRCHTVAHRHSQVVGYNVRYLLNGEVHTARTATKPESDRILVKDGQLILASEPVSNGAATVRTPAGSTNTEM